MVIQTYTANLKMDNHINDTNGHLENGHLDADHSDLEDENETEVSTITVQLGIAKLQNEPYLEDLKCLNDRSTSHDSGEDVLRIETCDSKSEESVLSEDNLSPGSEYKSHDFVESHMTTNMEDGDNEDSQPESGVG